MMQPKKARLRIENDEEGTVVDEIRSADAEL
jgi:hypothetical protein